MAMGARGTARRVHKGRVIRSPSRGPRPVQAKRATRSGRGREADLLRPTGPDELDWPTRVNDFLEAVDLVRLHASARLEPKRRGEFGQFMTPVPVARLMAGLFVGKKKRVRLLDAGAGAGSLTAAFVAERCRQRDATNLCVTAYEIDAALRGCLAETLRLCEGLCQEAGIAFTSRVVSEDFIVAGVRSLTGDLFTEAHEERFDAAILNPPYRKSRSDSMERRALRRIGVEAGNLYTAFLGIVTRLLVEEGELVAITPRSFCNGPYFRQFRQDFLGRMRLDHIHVFEKRDQAFRDDKVLQENVIFHATRGGTRDHPVVIASSATAEDMGATVREVPYDEVVRPDDPEGFIHLTTDGIDEAIATRMRGLPARLEELGVQVSTGRVVDFRALDFLRKDPETGSVPLIYPGHLKDGRVVWPRPGFSKANAIRDTSASRVLLVPAGVYVLVKRFSAKEEPRRVVAVIFDPDEVPGARVGFENHLNYFHEAGHGLPRDLALGLAVFLDSTLVDEYFRQFNGHTQVNATDLRSLQYPSRDALVRLGRRIPEGLPAQDELDAMVQEELFPMAEHDIDPVRAKKNIDDALQVLKDLGLPRAQQNERSALTLLALLDLKPGGSWAKVGSPLRGITEMMEFFEKEYGKRYAPNTRETVRRQTVHQFVQAGLVVQNPDEPRRPTNSPNNVYQMPAVVLDALRAYGTGRWEGALQRLLAKVGSLQERYANERTLQRIPVVVAPGERVSLSAGSHSALVKSVLDEFCACYTPGARVVYVGDTQEKWA